MHKNCGEKESQRYQQPTVFAILCAWLKKHVMMTFKYCEIYTEPWLQELERAPGFVCWKACIYRHKWRNIGVIARVGVSFLVFGEWSVLLHQSYSKSVCTEMDLTVVKLSATFITDKKKRDEKSDKVNLQHKFGCRKVDKTPSKSTNKKEKGKRKINFKKNNLYFICSSNFLFLKKYL